MQERGCNIPFTSYSEQHRKFHGPRLRVAGRAIPQESNAARLFTLQKLCENHEMPCSPLTTEIDSVTFESVLALSASPERWAMFVLLRCLFGALVAFSMVPPALADGEWTGKTIIFKRPGIKMGWADPASNTVYLVDLTALDSIVIKDEAGWLKIRVKGIEGWFQKTEAVLLEEAVDYFSKRIDADPQDPYAFAFRAERMGTKRRN